MRFVTVVMAMMLVLFSCKTDTGIGTDNIADHSIVDSVDSIPVTYMDAARNLDVYFEHASVGDNIMNGIASLSSSNPGQYSIRYTNSGFPSVASYADYELQAYPRGNPGFSTKVNDFVSRCNASSYASNVDVAMMKFCYIDSPLDPDNNPDNNANESFIMYRDAMLSLESSFSSTVFIWTTMPIQTSANSERQAYNDLVRFYCEQNNKWLLDIADIECHDPDGNIQLDGSTEVLYAAYTGDGGHPDQGICEPRIAKALWYLLARIAGY